MIIKLGIQLIFDSYGTQEFCNLIENKPTKININDEGTSWLVFVIAMLGVLTFIFSGLAELMKFREKWIEYLK